MPRMKTIFLQLFLIVLNDFKWTQLGKTSNSHSNVECFVLISLALVGYKSMCGSRNKVD